MQRKQRTLKQILNDSKTCVAWLGTYIEEKDKQFLRDIYKDIEIVLTNADVETLEEKY